MRLVFMGSPEFSATILQELLIHHQVCAVYTRADAVRGRGGKALPTPVKECALAAGIEVREPRTLRDAAEQEYLASLAPDAICVAAYGMILPTEVLDIPPYGCLNVHASLLPAWRGAAPIERAILHGDAQAGVCIMRMEEGLDTGDYCISRSVELGEQTAAELTEQLAEISAEALLDARVEDESGRVSWAAQDSNLVSYAEKIGKHELDISPSCSAEELCRKVRASGESHPCRACIAGKRLTVLAAVDVSADEAARALYGTLPAGEVCFAGKRLFIGTSSGGAVELLRVKPDGKQAMDARAFAAGIQGIKAGGIRWGAPDAE